MRSCVQLDAALDCFKKLAADGALDVAAFETACGVGVVITFDEITAAVQAEVENVRERLLEERYLFSTSMLQVYYHITAFGSWCNVGLMHVVWRAGGLTKGCALEVGGWQVDQGRGRFGCAVHSRAINC